MIPVVLLRRVLEGRRHTLAPGGIVIDQISDSDHAAGRDLYQLEPGDGVGTLPLAQLLDDVFDFLDLVLGALARIDTRNVDDGFFVRREYLEDVVCPGAGVEEITDIELLQVFVAIELLVVGIGETFERLSCLAVPASRSSYGKGRDAVLRSAVRSSLPSKRRFLKKCDEPWPRTSSSM